MYEPISRRQFLGGTLVLAAARETRRASAPPPLYYNPARLTHAGVSSWSFRDDFASTRPETFNLPSPLITLLDFPGRMADRYEVRHVEFSSLHFAGTDPAYLAELRMRIRRAGSRLVNIQLGAPELAAGGGLSDRDPGIRTAAVAAVKTWIDIARRTGAEALSVDPGAVNAADISPSISSFRVLVDYARIRGVRLLIESRDVPPQVIVDLIRATGSRWLGAVPGFAAFATPAARVAGLDLLFAYAPVLCHASGISFDRRGDEVAFDFRQCIQIARARRFRGIYSVVFTGPGNPYQGVQQVLNELVRYL